MTRAGPQGPGVQNIFRFPGVRGLITISLKGSAGGVGFDRCVGRGPVVIKALLVLIGICCKVLASLASHCNVGVLNLLTFDVATGFFPLEGTGYLLRLGLSIVSGANRMLRVMTIAGCVLFLSVGSAWVIWFPSIRIGFIGNLVSVRFSR